MVHRAERRIAAQHGDGRRAEKGLVAVRRGACLESDDLLPHGAEEMRLSDLCGGGESAGKTPHSGPGPRPDSRTLNYFNTFLDIFRMTYG